MTLDSFAQHQQAMSPKLVSDLSRAIINFDMPGIEAIVAGVDGMGSHIYVVTNSEVSCRDAVGFAAIGVGFWHANSQFMFAGHNRSMPLPETLLLTYAAKRRAEVAPGVGSATDMFTMGPAPGAYSRIKPEIIEDLGKIYKRTRKRAAQSVKKGNDEVTKYVAQLGKEATQQQQVSPAPSETTDREGNEGAADSGTGDNS
jgi:hypothetical protein